MAPQRLNAGPELSKKRELAVRFLPEAAYEEVPNEFELSPSRKEAETYEQYIDQLRRIMRKHEKIVNAHQGVRRKSWWDGEVQAALKARRAANRYHRHAVSPHSEDVQGTWQEYLHRKWEMQTITQRKIAAANHKTLQAIKSAGRGAAAKFWTYVPRLDGKAAQPEVRTESTGAKENDLHRALTDHLRQLYAPPPQGAPAGPLPAPDRSGLTGTDHQTWTVSRSAIDRAITRISARTARGLGGDIVLLAGSTGDLQTLITNCVNAMAPLGLQDTKLADTTMRGGLLPQAAEYRYLGVNFSAQRDYTANQEKHLRGASQRASQILRRKCLHIAGHSVCSIIHRNGIRTRWTKRLQQLSKKYGFFASPVQETERKWAKAVETLVRQTEADTWRRDMEGNVASSLLFEAQAGALRTLVYRWRFDGNVGSVMCRVCNVDQETIEHLVLHCASLTPTPIDGTTLPLALGFSPRVPSGGGGGDLVNQVATTKSRLQEWLSLQVMTLTPRCEHVETSQGVPLTVTGVAQCKVMTEKEFLSTAAEQFLGKDVDHIKSVILQTLEGHLRAILGTLTVEEVYRDRDQFASLVREVAAPDIGRMGIEILSFTIKDVFDRVEYLTSLGRARTAAVKRDADIGVAQAERDAGIRVRRCIKAEAQLAYELQAAKMKQKIRNEEIEIDVVERRKQITIEEKEILRREKELTATIRLPAEAEAYRMEMIAQGKRCSTCCYCALIMGPFAVNLGDLETVGKADAERMRMKAAAYKQFGDAAILSLVLDTLPKLAAEVAAPLAKTEEIVMTSGEDRTTAEVTKLVSQIPPTVQALTGIDLTKNETLN
ncbi:hypothetical protein HPB49_011876 [Dermacentor silvarum]|uniref:Uncharacterized protein n=1 Tax=Dermacentor silvarum TaxID=543639 RepID=A0ACB8D508_DERSI|nr:hypothetical protein HPB49_011876 [Dermacentor silvarum]